ncbi:conserved hypothetical protein [Gammaproteobacteria bacterium]
MFAIASDSFHSFSLNAPVIQDILHHAKPLGHNEVPNNLNLGFGFLYYGLVRALRPRHVLVIGSGFGFSVVCLALGLKDNDRGRLSFVDPSFSVLKDGPFKTMGGTGQWDTPEKVQAHFTRFGVDEWVTHHKLTSQMFFDGYEDRALPTIDLAFIDGNHSYRQVRNDFLSVLRHTRKNSYLLLHDTHIYLREAVRHAGVKRWLTIISSHNELFEVIDFPFSSGVAVVRVLRDRAWEQLNDVSV